MAFIGLAVFRVPLKVGNVEVGNKPTIVHDTIVKTRIDTQWVKVEPKSIKSNSLPVQKLKQADKTKDSVLPAKEPSNTNNGVNNGIIGNNNDVKINVNEIRRKLDDQSKFRLLELIDQKLKSNNLDKNSRIDIMSQMSDSEALGFAREILSFLKQNDYNVQDEIGQFQNSPIIVGVAIGFNKFNKRVEVKVGYRTKA